MSCAYLNGQPLYLQTLIPILLFIGVFINGIMLKRLFRKQLSNVWYRRLIILICGDSIITIVAAAGLFIQCTDYKLIQSLWHNVANLSYDLKMFLLNVLLVYWKYSIRPQKMWDRCLFTVTIVSNGVLVMGLDFMLNTVNMHAAINMDLFWRSYTSLLYIIISCIVCFSAFFGVLSLNSFQLSPGTKRAQRRVSVFLLLQYLLLEMTLIVKFLSDIVIGMSPPRINQILRDPSQFSVEDYTRAKFGYTFVLPMAIMANFVFGPMQACFMFLALRILRRNSNNTQISNVSVLGPTTS